MNWYTKGPSPLSFEKVLAGSPSSFCFFFFRAFPRRRSGGRVQRLPPPLPLAPRSSKTRVFFISSAEISPCSFRILSTSDEVAASHPAPSFSLSSTQEIDVFPPPSPGDEVGERSPSFTPHTVCVLIPIFLFPPVLAIAAELVPFFASPPPSDREASRSHLPFF